MKKPKYSAVPTTVNGIKFASKKEASRYIQLMAMGQRGEISLLNLQPRIKCQANGVLICTYVGDFVYYCRKRKALIYEDVKGFKTPVYKLKKKLVKALCNIEITEV